MRWRALPDLAFSLSVATSSSAAIKAAFPPFSGIHWARVVLYAREIQVSQTPSPD